MIHEGHEEHEEHEGLVGAIPRGRPHFRDSR